MYEIIKSVIESGIYNLYDIIKKINTLWVQGDITEDQKKELIELSQKMANKENNYAPLQEQIDEIFKEIEELKSTVNANAIGMSAIKDSVEKLGGIVSSPTEDPVEEYPEWYAWSGIGPIPWQNGTKCSHNGDKWVSHIENNIWEPGAIGVYENIWEKIKE